MNLTDMPLRIRILFQVMRWTALGIATVSAVNLILCAVDLLTLVDWGYTVNAAVLLIVLLGVSTAIFIGLSKLRPPPR